ncbi:YihY family inner membrane protein [Variovorax sp. J22R133]|uniref:YihY family inner membrane protein n=1 Tax=Variovorax brevis TaxID=3053503 RepID=UPI002575623E|nr:YhjD/YihY/BrkB family envelope integrity protein [Variovorax sp. J22R133]MDM0113466.1 YihY family inner membrane protein [Variovorax sp. J22R133]
MIPAMNRHQLWRDLSRFPWRNTAVVLGERFREDRLGLTASSLTFTTTIALVPFFTVALALFTVFPIFSTMQGRVQRWLIESLIPENIARQVLGYLTQFASKASGLGVAGLIVLLVTAIALILTMDKTLNAIWRVRKPRPFAQRVLIYWAAATLGPLVLAVSLSTTSYVFMASKGYIGGAGLKLLFDVVEIAMLAGGMASLYHYVPNTEVKWAHAWAGGLFVAAAIEIAKRVLAIYFSFVPTYSVLYGAFATLPILLVWIYVAWVIVLFGAVIAAYLPSLLSGVARRGGTPGWRVQLAIEVLQHLCRAQATDAKGLGAAELVARMRVDALQVAPVLETLIELDWIGRIAEETPDEDPRHVLLANPDTTPLEPLLRKLLLSRAEPLEALWDKGPLSTMHLRDVLPGPQAFVATAKPGRAGYPGTSPSRP